MSHSILLVDDEKDLLELFMEALKINGFQVCGFADSIEAYNHVKQCPDKYGLIISDFRMPNMNGNDLCSKLMDLNPNLKVVIMSAYEKVECDPNFTFISKPILLQQLLQIVKESLIATKMIKN